MFEGEGWKGRGGWGGGGTSDFLRHMYNVNVNQHVETTFLRNMVALQEIT